MISENSYSMSTRIIVFLVFVLMVVVNYLSNLLPLNGQTAGEVSDSYPNLFAPAGITFSIWGIIYVLLACYALYQLGVFGKLESNVDTSLFNSVAFWFVLSSVSNIAWIFSWHYHIIPLSLVLIIVILIALVQINKLTSQRQFSSKEKFFMKLPFSIYFGWITIATLANVIVLLVSVGWQGFGIAQSIWTILIILVGMLIGVINILRFGDIAYGLVIMWAYCGIIIKHVSATGFNNEYPFVIVAAAVSILIVLSQI